MVHSQESKTSEDNSHENNGHPRIPVAVPTLKDYLKTPPQGRQFDSCVLSFEPFLPPPQDIHMLLLQLITLTMMFKWSDLLLFISTFTHLVRSIAQIKLNGTFNHFKSHHNSKSETNEELAVLSPFTGFQNIPLSNFDSHHPTHLDWKRAS